MSVKVSTVPCLEIIDRINRRPVIVSLFVIQTLQPEPKADNSTQQEHASQYYSSGDRDLWS